MRKLKEGDYFAPKNKEHYGFILKSLREFGYPVHENTSVDSYDVGPIIIYDSDKFIGTYVNDSDLKNQLIISDLFTEEVEMFEVGQRVLVKNDLKSIWQFQIYDRLLHRDDFRHSCIGGAFNFCINYDTNKDKHGTI